MLTKLTLLLSLILSGAEVASAFSLLGPATSDSGNADSYQTTEIGYNLTGDIGSPKNLAEEYRWNTPVLYYASDSAFIDYFGSNGLAAVDQAMAILNSLTNMSSYSRDLSEFPLETARVNYRARASDLLDLKSVLLTEVVEQLGLAEPDRWTWCLRYRAVLPGGTCPEMEYTVIKRNFDPVTWEPSSYVNGTLYTYYIWEVCDSGGNGLPNADAIEIPVDPLAQTYTSVASYGPVNFGTFVAGLTRDDVGGLRYMWATNNINWELAATNSQVFVTNTQPELLFTTNLQFLAEAAATNDAATLQGLFPGLIVTSSSNYFVNVIQTNVTTYFTNSPLDPVGAAPRLVFATNYTTTVETHYVHTFGNVFTNSVYPYAVESVLITNIFPEPLTPVGSGISVTNIETVTRVNTNTVSGSFFLLPTNACDIEILYPQVTNVLTYTNFLTNTFTSITNTFTNASGSNITAYYEYSESELYYFTNVTYVARVIECPTNTPTLYQGMDGIRFVRRDYDSLLGRFYEPLTNVYMLNSVTNNQVVPRKFRRVVDNPDFLFTAGDPETDPNTGTGASYRPTPAFNTGQILDPTQVAGPGTIDPGAPIEILFSKVGPIYYNSYPDSLGEATATLQFVWGSFDDSTNAPVVYPVGSDLQSLENLLLMSVTQPSAVGDGGESLLPDAQLNSSYSFQLEGKGGVLPYTWSLAPGSAGLPNGLSLSASGMVSGTPTTAGTFDFTIRLTEGGGRHIDRPMSLIVLP